jgi:tripartite motif-containing protein 71
VSSRFDFLELGVKALAEENAEEETRAAEWKPLRLRCVEIIGEPGGKAGQFGSPSGIAVDPWGGLYVADTDNHRVQRITPAGEVYLYGRTGAGSGQLWQPQDVVVDPSGQFLFVADAGNHRVQCFRALNGQHLGFLGEHLVPFRSPSALAFDAEGMLWIADTGNSRVLRYNPAARQFVTVMERQNGIRRPVSLACDRQNTLYIGDTAAEDVRRLTYDGKCLSRLGENRRLKQPAHLAVDSGGRIFLVETGANRLQVFNSEGESLLVYDTPNGRLEPLKSPTGVALGPNGEVYLSDTLNHRILRLAWE